MTPVYLLDDDPMVNSMVEHALGMEQFKVYSSTLWSDVGRKILKEREPAILISDLNLPGIRGEDFCRSMRSHSPDIPIVLYSGGDPEFVEGVSQRLGGVDYVLKQRGGIPKLVEVVKRLASEFGGASASESPAAADDSTPSAATLPPYLLGRGHLPIPIEAEPVTIGRHPELNLTIMCTQVSRKHATFALAGDKVVITDLESRNGTWVNGMRIEGAWPVSEDATVRVGTVEFDLRFGLSAEVARKLCGQLFMEDTRSFRIQDTMTSTAQG